MPNNKTVIIIIRLKRIVVEATDRMVSVPEIVVQAVAVAVIVSMVAQAFSFAYTRRAKNGPCRIT